MGCGFLQTHGMEHRARNLLSKNITSLMEGHADLSTIKLLNARSGVPTGTLDRIRRGVVNAGVDHLDAIARAFDLEVWQLFVPDMDVKNPPLLASVSERQRELWEKLRDSAEQLARMGKD
jgi:transcriptional regulator with XRE-family HTH domain